MAVGPDLAPPAGARHERHVLERTIVLEDLRVLFLPVPKAGCTSVLWLLAGLAGVEPERFARSAAAEVSPALTVHDIGLWPGEHRLANHTGADRERVLTEPGWLRFSLVRDPVARLWSGWQSKLLLREPRFVAEFGDEPWFPRRPGDPDALVEDFRAFVAALGRGEAEDVHWAVQSTLVDQLPLGHVGRVERLAETLDLLRAHVPAGRWPAGVGRENRSALPLPAPAFGPDEAEVVRARFAPDFEAFGYDDADPADRGLDLDTWRARVAPALPALAATVGAHERIGELRDVAEERERRARAAEFRIERNAARDGAGPARVLPNLEGDAGFTVRWAWADGRPAPGVTGVLRVKDEARSLPWVLPALLRAVDRVVLVDNGSTDGSPELAHRIAVEAGAAERFEVHAYPHAIARCGAEHLATPPASVHSLVHFYNWSFALVRTGYALKWDGDMVLTDAAVAVLRDLAWQLEAAEAVVRVPRLPLYLADERRAFIDVALRNNEPWGWPNRPGFHFVKAMDWELPQWRADIATVTLPDWGCVELKHLDADEFAHWSPTDFDRSARTRRKLREWQVFGALTAGREPPEGVQEIVAPPGRHVVEYVRTTWLPDRARER